MWNPNIKVINITKLVQIIFNAWCGYFEYVSYLPRGLTLIVLNYCLNLIAINFNWSIWPLNIIQQEIYSMKLHKLLLTCLLSHSTLSTHYTSLFLCFSCVFTFLEIIKHTMLKCCFFLSYSLLKWLPPKSLILISFSWMLIWQLSQ